jgi:hypothetical protein
MLEINDLAVLAASVAAFVVSSVWYIIFGKARMKHLGLDANAIADMQKPQAWKMIGEFARSIIVAYVLAYFVVHLDITDWMGAVQLGILMWIGFPFVLLVGSVIWDNVPWKLAAIHAGDWLVKILLFAVILCVWR